MNLPNNNGSSNGNSTGCIFSTQDPIPETHGGLEAGTSINGQTACQVLEQILYPYQYPSFTSFYMENQSILLEVGDKVSGGVRTFKWSTSNSENIQQNSIVIKDLVTGSDLAVNLTNDGTEDIDIGTDKILTNSGSYSWQILAINTKNQTFTRNFTVNWYYRVYWGTSQNDNLTEDEIKSLENSALKPNFVGDYLFSNESGNQLYYYIVYPDEWGDYNSWVDYDTGFNIDGTTIGTIDITNDFGITITYRILRTTYQQTEPLNSLLS